MSSLTSPLASPWRSLTFCYRRMWSLLSSPSPLFSWQYPSWHFYVGSSICLGPMMKAKQPLHHFTVKQIKQLVWLCWVRERQELLLKVFYLCALGSSWLTSLEYWGLCDLNAALRLHSLWHKSGYSCNFIHALHKVHALVNKLSLRRPCDRVERKLLWMPYEITTWHCYKITVFICTVYDSSCFRHRTKKWGQSIARGQCCTKQTLKMDLDRS